MERKLKVIISLAAVIVMCAVIFWMSERPADESGALSMGVVNHIVGFIVPGYDQMSAAEQLYWQGALEHPVRKTAHFLEYALLGALTFNAAVQAGKAIKPAKAFAIAWTFATAYAVSDEIHQLFVDGRAGMMTDVLLDSAGAACGILLMCLVHAKLMRRSG